MLKNIKKTRIISIEKTRTWQWWNLEFFGSGPSSTVYWWVLFYTQKNEYKNIWEQEIEHGKYEWKVNSANRKLCVEK